MNIAFAESDVRRQLAAMACERVDLGTLSQSGRMTLAANWSAKALPSALRWLRAENAHGAHIFIRPAGLHRLSLIDDLTAEAIAELKSAGFEAAIVVETSLGNFQAWLRHGRILDQETSTYAAKELARRFGGDPSSADWRHFGRLAGFTNQKEKRRLPNGLAPFVKLREASCRTYQKAPNFFEKSSLWSSAKRRSGRTKERQQRRRQLSPSSHPAPFMMIRDTEAISIAPISRGPSMQPVADSPNSRSGMRFFMRATFQKRDGPADKSSTPNARRRRRSRSSGRRADYRISRSTTGGSPPRAALGQGKSPVRHAAIAGRLRIPKPYAAPRPRITIGVFSPTPDLGEGPGKRCSLRVLISK